MSQFDDEDFEGTSLPQSAYSRLEACDWSPILLRTMVLLRHFSLALVELFTLLIYRTHCDKTQPYDSSNSSLHGINVNKTLNEISEYESEDRRIYDFKKVGGAGCPYTASWLAHINLYRRITWYLDSTKMEAASFQVFETAPLKFQIADPDAYYVHHMSMFEHLIHRKEGFDIAQTKTLTLSKAAMKGECDNLIISKTMSYLALIPFFGGLPPGVNANLEVKSIGQGNSLVR